MRDVIGLWCMIAHLTVWAAFIGLMFVLPGHREPGAKDGCHWAEALMGPGIVCANETLNTFAQVLNFTTWTWIFYFLSLFLDPGRAFQRIITSADGLLGPLALIMPITLGLAVWFAVSNSRAPRLE